MCRSALPAILASVLAAAGLSCASSEAPPAVPPPPPPATVAVPPAPPPPSAPVATEAAPPPAPPGPQPQSLPLPPDPCRGAAFDLASLPSEACKTHHAGEPASQTSRLVVSLVPDAPRVHAGDTLGVSVVFTNTGHEPLPVDVNDGCSYFELGLYDAGGTRKDRIVGACGSGGGCGGSGLRLVVEPGGALTRHAKIAARVTRRTPQTQCEDADGGPLPPGRYMLRATAHLAGWLESVDGKHDMPSVAFPVEITR